MYFTANSTLRAKEANATLPTLALKRLNLVNQFPLPSPQVPEQHRQIDPPFLVTVLELVFISIMHSPAIEEDSPIRPILDTDEGGADLLQPTYAVREVGVVVPEVELGGGEDVGERRAFVAVFERFFCIRGYDTKESMLVVNINQTNKLILLSREKNTH